MLMLTVTTFVFIMYFITDIVPVYKNKQWKLFWAYSVMMAFAYVLLFLISIGIDIDSPLKPVKRLIIAIWGLK